MDGRRQTLPRVKRSARTPRLRHPMRECFRPPGRVSEISLCRSARQAHGDQGDRELEAALRMVRDPVRASRDSRAGKRLIRSGNTTAWLSAEVWESAGQDPHPDSEWGCETPWEAGMRSRIYLYNAEMGRRIDLCSGPAHTP